MALQTKSCNYIKIYYKQNMRNYDYLIVGSGLFTINQICFKSFSNFEFTK